MPGSSSKHPETRCKTCRRRRRISGITGRCLLCEAQTPRLLDDSPPAAKPDFSVRRDGIYRPALVVPGEPKEHKHDNQRLAEAPSMSRISHRAIQRSQLLDGFIVSAFPSIISDVTDTARQQSILTALRNFDLVSSPLMSEAVETLCLEAAASSDRGQTQLSHRAQDSHVQVLRRLNSALEPSSKVQKRLQGTHVAVAIILMLMRTSVNAAEQDIFVMHRNGLHQFLYTRAEAFDWTLPATKGMFENLRLQAILHRAGCPHKTQGLKVPPWLMSTHTMTPDLPSRAKVITEAPWHVEAELLPDLLDHVDAICQSESMAGAEVTRPYRRLDKVRTRLHRFRRLNATQEMEAAQLNDTVNIMNDSDSFDAGIEEHCFISTSTTFTQFYRFETHNEARGTTCAWLCSLLAQTAMLRLLYSTPTVRSNVEFPKEPDIIQQLASSAYATACDLCRCTWYFATFSTSIAHADFIRAFLLAAQGTFEACRATTEYSWTQTCLFMTEVRIKRLRDAGRKTFCHVREVQTDIKRRCSWTS